MTTRQYIGARYVPKFYVNSVDGSSSWEPNVVYQPLVFVTLTNGHLYISRKEVPATIGSPASNIAYWLDMGSYNGFVQELQDEIDVINDEKIPLINSEIESLKQNNGDGINYNFKTVKADYPYNDAMTFLTANSDYYSLQGVTFNRVERVYAFLIIKNNNDGMLVLVDDTLSNVITRKTYVDTIGHGNQLCYNPRTNRYLVCPSYSTSEILEIDATTLNVVARHAPIGSHSADAERLASITYDEDHDIYYCETWNGIYKLDATFNTVAYFAIPYMDYVKNFPRNATTYPNGFVYYNDRLYVGLSTAYDNTTANFVLVLNTDGTLNNRLDIPAQSLQAEIESLAVVDGTLRTFERGYGFLVKEIYLYNNPVGIISNLFGTSGEEIPSGADLNNYTRVGKYAVPSRAILNTLINAPTIPSNCVLYVIPIGGYLKQVAVGGGTYTVIASRRYVLGTGVWEAWTYDSNILLSGMSKTFGGNFAGIVTGGGYTFAFDIPMNYIGTPTASFTNANIRTISGYYQLDGQNAFSSDNSHIQSITFENHRGYVSMLITFDTAYTNNNTPIVFSGTIDFVIS